MIHSPRAHILLSPETWSLPCPFLCVYITREVKLVHVATVVCFHCRGYKHQLCSNCRLSHLLIVNSLPLLSSFCKCTPLYLSISILLYKIIDTTASAFCIFVSLVAYTRSKVSRTFSCVSSFMNYY